jgi:hypothetical protein
MGSSDACAAASGANARKRQVISDRIMMANDISGRGGVRRDLVLRDMVERDMTKRDMTKRGNSVQRYPSLPLEPGIRRSV